MISLHFLTNALAKDFRVCEGALTLQQSSYQSSQSTYYQIMYVSGFGYFPDAELVRLCLYLAFLLMFPFLLFTRTLALIAEATFMLAGFCLCLCCMPECLSLFIHLLVYYVVICAWFPFFALPLLLSRSCHLSVSSHSPSDLVSDQSTDMSQAQGSLTYKT